MKQLPDIANEHNNFQTLEQVGMGAVELALSLKKTNGILCSLPARARVTVNLSDSHKRGIHMSRMYRLLDEWSVKAIDVSSTRQLMLDLIQSQQGLSDKAYLQIDTELPVRRPSLLSGNSGWRTYPIQLIASGDSDETKIELQATVSYSSTCPESAALSRQALSENFEKDFPENLPEREKLIEWLLSKHNHATPHSQRSHAKIRVSLNENCHQLDWESLINIVEEALKTPVQTSVKRMDEKQFAILNGKNLLFCEDAARRLHSALHSHADYSDFVASIEHFESLHPHNAISKTCKGISGGYSADTVL